MAMESLTLISALASGTEHSGSLIWTQALSCTPAFGCCAGTTLDPEAIPGVTIEGLGPESLRRSWAEPSAASSMSKVETVLISQEVMRFFAQKQGEDGLTSPQKALQQNARFLDRRKLNALRQHVILRFLNTL